jgi:hypothetical protein
MPIFLKRNGSLSVMSSQQISGVMTIDKFYKHPSSPHQACSIEAELAWEMDIRSTNSIPRLQSEQKKKQL